MNWTFDARSWLLGLAAGLLLAFILGRLRQPLRRIQQQVQGRITAARRWISAGVEVRYRAELAEYARYRHFGAGAAQLSDMFVPVRFVAPLLEPQPTSDAILPHPQIAYLWPDLAPHLAIEAIETISLGRLIASCSRAAFVAPSGGGKSTALSYLALACAHPEQSTIEFHDEALPILLHLGELQLSVDRTAGQAPEEPLIVALQDRAGSLTTDSLPNLLRGALGDGRALVLADGWDELAPAERTPISLWLGELMSAFPECKYFVSAPDTGFGPLLDLGFVPFQIRPWQASEATQLARGWAEVLGANLPTVRDSQRPGAQQVPALDFWQTGMTPLEITMNLWLMLVGEKPPMTPVDRLGSAVRHILLPFGGTETNWPLEIAHQVLGALAQRMEANASHLASRVEIRELVSQSLRQREIEDTRIVDECCQVLIDQCGILTSHRKELVAFSSPVLFGYFWAYQLAATGNAAAALHRLPDPSWSDALSNYIRMADPEPLIEQLLTGASDLLRDGLFLAADWVAATESNRWSRAVLVQLAKILLDAQSFMALRERAVAALVKTRDEGVRYLLQQALASPDTELRALATRGLGALAANVPGRAGDESSLQMVIRSIQDPSEKVRIAAIQALAASRDEAAIAPLIATLLEASPDIRSVAAESIARMGEEGYQILREALGESDVLVRRAALSGLALVDEPWIIPLLETVMREDQEWLVRAAAEDQLNQRAASSVPAPLSPPQADQLAWLVAWAAERGSGVPAGPAASAILERVLQEDDDHAIRASAARSLGDLGNINSVAPLLAALEDPSPAVREAVFFGLVRTNRARHQRFGKKRSVVASPASQAEPRGQANGDVVN